VDISRYDELLRRYTLPYDAANTELAEGMHLRRRQSAPRLAKFPRLLAKVIRDAKAGLGFLRRKAVLCKKLG